MRKQIAVFAGIADEFVLLDKRRNCPAWAVCIWSLCSVGLDGIDRLGEEGLGKKQHALIAVNAALQRLGTCGIHAVRRVTAHQANNAPEM